MELEIKAIEAPVRSNWGLSTPLLLRKLEFCSFIKILVKFWVLELSVKRQAFWLMRTNFYGFFL